MDQLNPSRLYYSAFNLLFFVGKKQLYTFTYGNMEELLLVHQTPVSPVSIKLTSFPQTIFFDCLTCFTVFNCSTRLYDINLNVKYENVHHNNYYFLSFLFHDGKFFVFSHDDNAHQLREVL